MSFRLYVADAFWENRTRGYFPEVMEALAWKKVPHISEMVFRKWLNLPHISEMVFRKWLNLPHISEMELEQDEMGAETCLSVKAYGEYRRYDKQ